MTMSRLDRRWILRGLAASVFAPGIVRATEHTGQGRFVANPFSLGVASGDPDSNSVVLWTRLAPSPFEPEGGMGQEDVPVEWTIASDESMRTVVGRGKYVTQPQSLHSVHVVAEGLQPGRHYWYQFRARGVTSPKGRTKTLPAVDVMPDRFRIGVGGCQRIDHGYYTAWADLAAADLDLVFHYGDYIYNTRLRERRIAKRLGVEVPAEARRHTRRLVDFRLRYSVYKSDPDLAAVHAAHPFVMTYDDHEVGNNWAGLNDRFRKRVGWALQAYYEHMPLRPASKPRNGRSRMYRSLQAGRLLRLSALDTRQHRSPQACGGRGRMMKCDERTDPNRTMLGLAQEKWLDREFAGPRCVWNVLGNQVLMMPALWGGRDDTETVGTDKWDGYAAARDRLLESAVRNELTGFVVFSGDLHQAFAGNILAPRGGGEPRQFGVELLGSSISSSGDGAHREARGRRILRNNPHIKFFDGRRGNLICTFEQNRLLAEFRALDVVRRRNAPIKTIASFEIDPQRPELA